MAVSLGIKVRDDVEVQPTNAGQPEIQLDSEDQVQAYIYEVARIAAGDIYSSDAISGLDLDPQAGR